MLYERNRKMMGLPTTDEEKNMNDIIGAALKSINIEMQTFGMAMMMS